MQSWGDLTQIQVYGGGMAIGPDGQTLKLDDAAIESFKELDHVQAATAYISAYNLQGQITAGRGDRYAMDLGNMTGVDPAAMEPMGFVPLLGALAGHRPRQPPRRKNCRCWSAITRAITSTITRRSMNSPKALPLAGPRPTRWATRWSRSWTPTRRP